MTDPQLDTTSPAEEHFRSELADVFPGLDFDISHLWQDRWMVATSRRISVEYAEHRTAKTRTYTVEAGDLVETAPTLKQAVAALESAGWEP